jgi:hypothetical protein
MHAATRPSNTIHDPNETKAPAAALRTRIAAFFMLWE